MTKQMDADQIIDQIAGLADAVKASAIRNIIDELSESGWVIDGDEDTWQAGFNAAIAVIKSNFVY